MKKWPADSVDQDWLRYAAAKAGKHILIEKPLSEGCQPELSAQDAIQATRIVLAADRAIRTGEVQEL